MPDSNPDAGPACLNCGRARGERFCGYCGQNDRNYIRSAWSVMGDLVRETLEVDSKLLQTLKQLVRPGRLSAEFSHNHRANYMSPVRMYLFATILYFFAFARAFFGGVDTGTMDPSVSFDVTRGSPAADSAGVDDATGAVLDELAPDRAQVDALKTRLEPRYRQKLDDILSRPGEAAGVGTMLAFVGEIEPRAPGETGWLEKAFWSLMIDFLHDPVFFMERVIGNLSVSFLCLLPFQALVFAIIYLRKKRYFVEHLVFQIHLQTFCLLASAIPLLLPAGVVANLIWFGTSVWILYYTLAAMRHFYRDGWIWTVIKGFLALILYSSLLIPAFIGAVALSL